MKRRETALMFIGVNEGFPGDSADIKDPEKAMAIVRRILKETQGQTGDSNRYDIHPGLAVYQRSKGCPINGEAVATLLTADHPAQAIATAKILRARLEQENLTVGTYIGNFGTETLGFFALAEGDMRLFAGLWQILAARQLEQRGVYVSAGLYRDDSGQLVIQAEAHPEKIRDIEAWKQAVEKIAGIITMKTGTELIPIFRKAGFTYLTETK